MVKKGLALLAVFVAGLAFTIWLVQRSGEKILFLDRERSMLSVIVGEMRTLVAAREGARTPSIWGQSEPCGVAWCITAGDGDLVVRKLDLVREKPFAFLGKASNEPFVVIDAVRSRRIPLLPVGIGSGLLAIVLLLPPLIIKPIIKKLRSGRNQCVGCGYLLVGLSSGRCPECGKPIPPSAQSTGTNAVT